LTCVERMNRGVTLQDGSLEVKDGEKKGDSNDIDQKGIRLTFGVRMGKDRSPTASTSAGYDREKGEPDRRKETRGELVG